MGEASRSLLLERLTKAAFAPFGDVVEADPKTMRLINSGTTQRFHALSAADVWGEGARAILSLFIGQPRSLPYEVSMMERHPFGSQSFQPLDGRDWLVVVAEDEGGKPGRPRLFLATGRQGINIGANVWHHPLMALDKPSAFLVVDRDGPGINLEEHDYPQAYLVEEFRQ